MSGEMTINYKINPPGHRPSEAVYSNPLLYRVEVSLESELRT